MELTTLRLAATAALLRGGNTPYPTIAGEHVYDSLMDDIPEVTAVKRFPVIVVRTDRDEAIFDRSQTPKGRQARLLVEISTMTSVGYVDTDGKERLKLDWPKSSPVLEAHLNMMQWQVWNALEGQDEWALWFRTFGYALINFISDPKYSAPDRGQVRLAARSLEFMYTVPNECLAPALHEFDPEVPPFLPPSLIKVLNDIDNTGAGDFKKGIISLGKSISRYGSLQRPRVPALQRVWLTLPDYETEADWRITQFANLSAPSLVAGSPSATDPQLN